MNHSVTKVKTDILLQLFDVITHLPFLIKEIMTIAFLEFLRLAA
ncbi:hypothetical protein [Paenibacillus luteus]|nr:hypothetical protein [Paenibacillus luteus]